MTLLHQNKNKIKPARIVLIGSSGFIGSELLKYLQEKNVEVLSLSSKECNLLDPDECQKIATLLKPEDAIVFISAITPDRGRDFNTVGKNLRMAENFCHAISQATFSHMVYLSSDAVYENNLSIISEKSSTSPESYHGYMHIGRELLFQQIFAAAKIPLARLRPVSIYGTKDTHNSYGPNRFMRSALHERKIVLFGKGEEKRDHVFIQDLIEIIWLVLQYRSEGVLNIATGTSISFFDIAQEISNLVEGHVEFEYKPRVSSITHSHFDCTASIQAFPT